MYIKQLDGAISTITALPHGGLSVFQNELSSKDKVASYFHITISN